MACLEKYMISSSCLYHMFHFGLLNTWQLFIVVAIIQYRIDRLAGIGVSPIYLSARRDYYHLYTPYDSMPCRFSPAFTVARPSQEHSLTSFTHSSRPPRTSEQLLIHISSIEQTRNTVVVDMSSGPSKRARQGNMIACYAAIGSPSETGMIK